MWFTQEKIDLLTKDKKSYDELKKENERLEKELKTYKDHFDNITSAVRSSTFAFDFNTVKAFSIERNINKSIPVTIIGYFLPEARVIENDDGVVTNDIVREWYLYCSQEQHEKLVEQFNAAKK